MPELMSVCALPEPPESVTQAAPGCSDSCVHSMQAAPFSQGFADLQMDGQASAGASWQQNTLKCHDQDLPAVEDQALEAHCYSSLRY